MAGDRKERLNRALGGRSIRSVQTALEHIPGCGSYSNVHSYFKSDTAPSVEFLEAAAEELGVRPEWLAFGKGPMNDAEEITTRATEAAEIEQEVMDALRRSFPAIGRQVQGPAVDAAYRTWSHLLATNAQRDGHAGDFVATANKVGEAMQAPLRALGIRHQELSLWGLGAYAQLVAQAIQVVTATPGMLRPMPEVMPPNEETPND